MLSMRNITKEFFGVKALDGVGIDVAAGEIHGLIGENGAGKSTLMKILGGLHPAGTFSGSIVVDGNEHQFASTRDSAAAGIAMIHQELELVAQLSICENIMLGSEIAWRGVIDRSASETFAARALARVGLREMDVRRRVGDLSLGQQQLVEIAKALAKRKRLLVLDEPTTSLSDVEARHLLVLLRTLAAEGTSCIFITHRLGELLSVADRVTVLRDGRKVAVREARETTAAELITLMVGRPLDQTYPRRSARIGEVAISVTDWTVADPARIGGNRLSGITFQARAGEVLGIAGLIGAGRTELATSLIGAYPGRRLSGTLHLSGRPVVLNGQRQALAAGVSYVPEDRKKLGLVLSQSIARNMTLASPNSISRFGILDGIAEDRLAQTYISSLGIKCRSPNQPVRTLSGGNQQKVVLAKFLQTGPRILILDEPTRGVDVGARFEIYRIVNELAESGVCIILISSDLPEILGMADRVIVMSEGRNAGELRGGELTEENVIRLAVPQARAA